MIIEKRILDFEKLGFGMFVHFGLYSLLGKGEWAQECLSIPQEEYRTLAKTFCPATDWAEKLADAAKHAGCKYITLTDRVSFYAKPFPYGSHGVVRVAKLETENALSFST